MKIFRIDFAQDNPCVDGCYVGRIGEHNATELIITPPAAMTENEAVTSYIIAFVTGGMLIHSEPFEKAETVHIKLWRQLTQNATIGIQLEAYDDAGDFIGKSEYIKSLKFLPSADGDNVSSDTDNPDLISGFLKIKHSHKNKEMLDKFSEDDDGNPLYNGQSIGNSVGSGITDEQAAEIAANTESRHTHGNKTVSVPADEVSYTHNNIQDTSGTVKGALNEAIDYVTGTVSKSIHSHSNKEVLDRFSEALGDLYSVTYNGVQLLNEYHLLNYATKQELQNAINGIGGSTAIKVMSFPQLNNSDITNGHSVNEILGFIFDSEDMSKNPLPENAIVVDVGIVLNDDTEIRRNQMWNSSAFGSAIVEICNTPVYDETYCYPVLRVVDTGKASFTQPLFETLMSDGYKQFNVYYI